MSAATGREAWGSGSPPEAPQHNSPRLPFAKTNLKLHPPDIIRSMIMVDSND